MGTDATEDGQPTVIPLRDGSELRVDAEGVRAGETLYRLEQIQDARQVSPDPETIGLRVDGVGLVTLIPARPGDAAVALEALFRLRPELRPAGFGPAGMGAPPAGAWPYGPPPGYGYPPPPYGYGAPPGYPPAPGYPGYPPPGYGYPPAPGYGYPPAPGYGYPPPYPGYAIVPPVPGQPGGAQGGDPYGGPKRPGVGPWPQGIGDVLGTTFRLFFYNFWRLALLGVAVALLPALLVGALETAIAWAEGLDPTQGALGQQPFGAGTTPGGLPNAPLFQWIERPPDPSQIALVVGIGLLVFVLLLVLGTWETASLAWGARELVRGRPVRVGRAMGGGLGRTPKVLGTTLLIALIIIALEASVGAPLVFGYAVSIGLLANTNAGSAASAALLGTCLFFVIYIAIFVGVIYVVVRLSLAPYAAACDGLSPGRAIARSWTLTRKNWWRTFIPALVIGFVVGMIAGAASSVELVSLIVLYLVAVPLLTALSAPLTATVAVVIYYDLRLRREGFPPLASELGLPGFGPMPVGPMADAPSNGGADASSGPTVGDAPPMG